MEIGHLRVLRELRDRGSIAAVAASMYVTPSSISQQIAALQRSAGVPLTRREGRRTVLTDAGRALASAAVDVETALARAESAISAFAGATEPISVSAFHSAAITLLPPLVAADGPTVTVADEDVSTERFPDLTMVYDLVIAHRMVGSPSWPTTVAAIGLLAEPLDLAFRPGHRLDGRARVGPSDLVEESWIAVHEGFPLDDAVRRVAGAAGHDPTIAHRVNDFEAVAALLRATDHIAFLPRWMRPSHGSDGVRLVPLVGDFGLTRRVDLIARPEALERPGVREVVSQLKRLAKEVTTRD